MLLYTASPWLNCSSTSAAGAPHHCAVGGLTAGQPCAQGVYRSFVANAKFVNAASLAHISFMGACVVELFGLEPGAAYGHAFTHIKELAVLLRGALANKAKDAFRDIYCWQTINCLELWGRLMAAHANKQVHSHFLATVAPGTK